MLCPDILVQLITHNHRHCLFKAGVDCSNELFLSVPRNLIVYMDSFFRCVKFQPHKKVSLLTRRHIIKGSSSRLPFAALNEYLCMQVVGRVVPAARTEVSRDGNALVVYRFDVDEQGQPLWGMEDFCALLGLRPAAKYDTTWERIARAVRDHVPGEHQYETFRRLAATLLFVYALRNADYRAKNLALLYFSRKDVHLSPAYDFLTTNVYVGYQYNPPGIAFLGRKTWTPGKNLVKFITSTFGISAKEQSLLLESISDAVADVVPSSGRRWKSTRNSESLGSASFLPGTKGLLDYETVASMQSVNGRLARSSRGYPIRQS